MVRVITANSCDRASDALALLAGVTVKNPRNPMLKAALRLFCRVDDLRRLDFTLGETSGWEPPLDLIETAGPCI